MATEPDPLSGSPAGMKLSRSGRTPSGDQLRRLLFRREGARYGCTHTVQAACEQGAGVSIQVAVHVAWTAVPHGKRLEIKGNSMQLSATLR